MAPKTQQSRPAVFQCMQKKKKTHSRQNTKILSEENNSNGTYRAILMSKAKEKKIILILPLFEICHSVHHRIFAFFKNTLHWNITWITEFCGTSLNGGISTYDKGFRFLTLVPAPSTRLELCVYGPHWLWKIRSDQAIASLLLSF